MMQRRSSGFTMLEILAALVVVAILAGIAIPSYSAYVVRGQRAAAKVALEQGAQFMERSYTSNGCYNYAAQADCQSQSGTALALPASLASAPNGGGAFTYAITLAAQGQGFTLSATPCGDGSGCTAPGSNTAFTDAGCDVLTLDNTGAKTASGTLGSVTCWQR